MWYGGHLRISWVNTLSFFHDDFNGFVKQHVNRVASIHKVSSVHLVDPFHNAYLVSMYVYPLYSSATKHLARVRGGRINHYTILYQMSSLNQFVPRSRYLYLLLPKNQLSELVSQLFCLETRRYSDKWCFVYASTRKSIISFIF